MISVMKSVWLITAVLCGMPSSIVQCGETISYNCFEPSKDKVTDDPLKHEPQRHRMLEVKAYFSQQFSSLRLIPSLNSIKMM